MIQYDTIYHFIYIHEAVLAKEGRASIVHHSAPQPFYNPSPIVTHPCASVSQTQEAPGKLVGGIKGGASRAPSDFVCSGLAFSSGQEKQLLHRARCPCLLPSAKLLILPLAFCTQPSSPDHSPISLEGSQTGQQPDTNLLLISSVPRTPC